MSTPEPTTTVTAGDLAFYQQHGYVVLAGVLTDDDLEPVIQDHVDIVEDVERQMARRVVDGISLARKAGRAVAGYEKVKSWLATGEAAILIQATDGSGRGKSKLSSPPGKGTYIGVLTASELGLAFGREHVIHAALAAGRLTKRVVEDASRLSGLREDVGGNATGKGTKTI